MLPDPLHPAIVHIPLGVALVTPCVVLFLFELIRRERMPARSWSVVILLQAILAISAYLAAEAGEDEEDRVEKYVHHDALELHEERAELLEITAWVGLGVAALGLFGGKIGTWVRGLMIVAALTTATAAYFTGKSGGELVYRERAPAAYWDGGADADQEREDEHRGKGK